MKLLFIFLFCLFSTTSFAKEQKLEFQYNFKDYTTFEKEFSSFGIVEEIILVLLVLREMVKYFNME